MSSCRTIKFYCSYDKVIVERERKRNVADELEVSFNSV